MTPANRALPCLKPANAVETEIGSNDIPGIVEQKIRDLKI